MSHYTFDIHLSFSSHVAKLFSNAKSRLHALLVLKRHGVDKASLIRFYLANIRTVLSYAAPAWYCYISETCKTKLESLQRQCMRVIYPDIPYEERLAQAGILPLCDYLNTICQSYVDKIATNTNHKLHHHMPKRQSSRGRHSSRLRDVPLGYKNYTITRNSLFSKYMI